MKEESFDYGKIRSSAKKDPGELDFFEDVLSTYGKAIQENSDPSELWVLYFNRGSIYYQLSRNEEALADYDKAIELNPDSATAETYENRGNAYYDLKRYKEALTNYNKAIELNPNHSSFYYSRGNIYDQLNRNEEALADYNKAIELNPDEKKEDVKEDLKLNKTSFYYEEDQIFHLFF